MNEPNYYGIIPASVRYNKDLTFLEKFLYCEITALSNVDGYCYCKNDYFAKLYNKTSETISRALSNLERLGYIYMEYEREGAKIKERKIFLTDTKKANDKIVNRTEIANDKNVNREQQKFLFAIDKIVKENNVTYNNILSLIMYNMPSDIKTIVSSFNFSETLEKEIYKWLQYKKEKKQSYKPTGLSTLLKKLKKMLAEHGEEYVINAIENSISQNYSGIFAQTTINKKPTYQTKQKQEVEDDEDDWLVQLTKQSNQ